jgi:mannosyltransferase OCH1-like enzyme
MALMNKFIPKIIHISWVKKDILNDSHPLIQNGIKNLVELNPDWNLTIYNDEEVDDYLKNNLDSSDYHLIQPCGIVPKTDLWRLIKLYLEGGLYSDLDRYHNIPLNNILEENTKCVLPTWNDYDFSHTFMMSAPNNPIFSTAINMVLHRRRMGNTDVYLLGPQTYMHAVTHTLMGEMINTDPGVETFSRIRSIISEMKFIKTYRETSPGNLITNRSDITEEEFEKQKREYYAYSGLKHWTGNW